MYFAWKALRGFSEAGPGLPIYNERDLNKPGKDSLHRISALAWDLWLFRWWETLSTQMTGNNFYMPAITTFDQRLLDTVRGCPLRALLIHDGAAIVEALFDDERAFQDCLNSSLSPQTVRRIDEFARRPQVPDLSRYALSASILQLEQAVARLL